LTQGSFQEALILFQRKSAGPKPGNGGGGNRIPLMGPVSTRKKMKPSWPKKKKRSQYEGVLV